MKILFPSVFFLPQTIGGIELYIYHLAMELKKRGHEVKVMLPLINETHGLDYSYCGLDVLRYQSRLPANRLQYAGLEADAASMEAFKKLLHQEQPDIVHFNQLTNSSGISLFHLHAAKDSGARVVYTNHLSEFICQRGDLQYRGTSPCDGIVKNKKCTECLLVTKGMYRSFAKALSEADEKLAMLVGKKKFATQLRPIVFPGFFTRWHTEKNLRLLAVVDAFVSIADWSSELLEANGWANSKCVVIKTGLPVTEQNRAVGADKIYDGKRPLRVVFMGRVFPVKGLDLLIDAMKTLPAESVELSVYGPKDPGMYSGYYDDCMTAGTAANIFFYGAVENDKVVEILSAHDLLIVPSRGNEMAPLVIQEAYRAGIPVIGSDLPALREWIKENSSGLIFAVGNAESLENKIRMILQQPSLLELFKKNIPRIRSFSEVADEYEELYTSIQTETRLK